VGWTEQELRDLAAHLGLESARGGDMELVLRAKSGNEARIWSSEDMGVEFGTPTCPCSECRGRGWYILVSRRDDSPPVRRVCNCGAPEREDPGYDRLFNSARRAAATKAAHKAAGLCTLHNGYRYCGRASHVGAASWGHESHEFTGPRIDGATEVA
jgi:hypothetical protein